MSRFEKRRSTWVPQWKIFLKQVGVSLISYLTLPFFKKRENGVLLFFERNYYNKKDELVFDGNTGNYFDIIDCQEARSALNNANLLDLGCGRSSFYSWLKQKDWSIESYTGLDFAIKPTRFTDDFRVYNDNILNFTRYISGKKNVLFLCNVLCYLSEEDFYSILEKSPLNCTILVIEPSPGFFWDAHFDGIKPNYRKMNDVVLSLQAYGYSIEKITQDYLFSIRGVFFLFPLSYFIYGKRESISCGDTSG